MKNETQYRKFLITHKNTNSLSAPATDEEYADFWVKSVKDDVTQLHKDRSEFKMHFHKFQKDGPLLVLDKQGEIPEKNKNYIEACEGIGLEMGLPIVVEYNADGNEGIVCTLKAL